MNNLINDIQTLSLWHYRRKSNSLLMTVIFMAFYLTACTDNIDSPVVTPVTTMSLTVNGENYEIDRTDSTGNILWRVAGADNDGSYAFHGQHCARYQQKDNTITLFNNGNGTGRTQMLRLEVDLNTGQASKSTILLDDGYFTQACGALTFSDDNMIVGWGIPGDETTNNRVVTEYDAAGTEIFSISRLTNTKSINSVLGSYRCVKCK